LFLLADFPGVDVIKLVQVAVTGLALIVEYRAVGYVQRIRLV